MKSKEKVSIALDDYTSLLLEKAVDRYDLNQIVGRARPWLIKEALKAVAFAIIESSNKGKLALPLTVALAKQTEQQKADREKLWRESQGELFPEDSFAADPAEQKATTTIWAGFTRKTS